MHEHVHHTEVRHGYTIRIIADTDYEHEWKEDDGLFLVAFADRYFFVDRPGFTREDFRDADRLKAIRKLYHVLPLTAYIHSGVALSLSGDHYPFNCPWDSGQIGFVLAAKSEWPRRGNKLDKVAHGFVATCNDVLSGNVWGYTITDAEGEEVESSWGYVGDYDPELILEVRSTVDSIRRRHVVRHLATLRAYISNHVPLDRRDPCPA